MCSSPMVVGEVPGERAPEMRLVEDDDVIETFAPNRSDHAFDVRVLPWTRRRRDDFTDAHAGDSAAEEVAIDGVRSRKSQSGPSPRETPR
jgi:hypothetical protein